MNFNILTSILLKVYIFGPHYLCLPLTFMGLFACMGPFCFCVVLLHLYRALHFHVAPH